jgi:hypothetical protein
MTSAQDFTDQQAKLTVPIVLGVTGHRDIPVEDIEILKTVIKAKLKEFSDRCPDSPMVLVTGLAEGADRLVARCALELNALEPQHPRWAVGAILALPQAEFEKDFKSASSLADFRKLLSQCAWVRTLGSASSSRPECYELVGHWIAQKAQWLIALWDGEESEKKGGTAAVVKLFREGAETARPVLPDTGPVIHILTRRQQSAMDFEASSLGIIKVLSPNPLGLGGDAKEIARWHKVLERINTFNSRVAGLKQNDFEQIKKCRSYLNANQFFIETELTTSARKASWLHAAADYFANKAQQWRNRQFAAMLILAIIGLGFEQYYSGLAEGDGWTVGIWLLLSFVFGFLALLPRTLAFLNSEAKYLDYRALAEACRVQYFWKRSHIDACVADFHLFDQRDELEWIRQATRTTELGGDERTPQIQTDWLERVSQCWLVHQKDYFNVQFPKHEAWARQLNKLALTLLLLAAVIMIVTFIVQVTSSDNHVKWLQFTYGMLLTCAGATKVYLQAQGHEEHARSFLRAGLSMTIVEKMITSTLDKSNDALGSRSAEQDIRARKLLFEVGKEALNENGDWLLLHRERPVQPPI